MGEINLEKRDNYWLGRFGAMASPCEILIETEDRALAAELLKITAGEAQRIEKKFSRYRNDSIVHRINNNRGRPVAVDPETAQLLDFAQTLYRLSGGLFDITSGVLRKAWTFDGGNHIPDHNLIAALLPCIGWDKVSWENSQLSLPDGMQIDFGGIGKEYAVDKAVLLVKARSDAPCLINFGGDLAVTRARNGGRPWQIGIESTQQPQRSSEHVLHLERGALATSGDVRRYLLKDGVRYGHILNPKTGWPVVDTPRSVTVAADTCTEAGMLATLAMLQGKDCEVFLDTEGVRYWCIR
ncbi:MAG TPA: FAD:protein FMN transferase [Gammaproteobacteria bacterium]|jgi:thiamine biosynthesis lipoprotein